MVNVLYEFNLTLDICLIDLYSDLL